jgi:hypothetical protein
MILFRVGALLVPLIASLSLVHRRKTTERQQIDNRETTDRQQIDNRKTTDRQQRDNRETTDRQQKENRKTTSTGYVKTLIILKVRESV